MKNNFMLIDPQLQMQKLPQKCLLLQCALISLHLIHFLTGRATLECKNQTSSSALPVLAEKN